MFEHPSENDLRAYALGNAAPETADAIEEHYFACLQCQASIAEMDTIIEALQIWAAELPAVKILPRDPRPQFFPVKRTNESRKLNWKPITALAAALLLGLATTASLKRLQPVHAPATHLAVARPAPTLEPQPIFIEAPQEPPSDTPIQPVRKQRKRPRSPKRPLMTLAVFVPPPVPYTPPPPRKPELRVHEVVPLHYQAEPLQFAYAPDVPPPPKSLLRRIGGAIARSFVTAFADDAE